MNKKLVYKGHGICEVIKTETKFINSKLIQFNVLKVVDTQMVILVPEYSNDLCRELISKEDAKSILKDLKEVPMARVASEYSWQRRYRDFMELIKTGYIENYITVFKSLNYLISVKELSFGERKMHDHVKDLLVAELSESLNLVVEL